MKWLILTLIVCINATECLALEKQQRIDAALAAIGAYVVEKQDQKNIEAAFNLKNFPQYQIHEQGTLHNYYQGNFETYFTTVAGTENTKILKKIGLKFVEGLFQKLAKPICKKYVVCHKTCYIEVAGDIVEAVIISQPELTPLRYLFQTYVIDGGLNFITKLCNC